MIYIFDIDGTIANRDDTRLYSHFIDWLVTIGRNDQIYLATNQGGVGLRYWMSVNQFGEPDKYPTQEQVVTRITLIVGEISSIIQRPVMPYISYAYQSKAGNWSPLPGKWTLKAEHSKPYYTKGNFRASWCQNWHKPNPGMLQAIYSDCVQRFDVRDLREYLVVGDMETDKMAAESVNLPFCYVNEFFK